MSSYVLRHWALVLIVAVVLITWIRVRISPAYGQKPDQITIRGTGERRLRAPEDASTEAREDVEFALLSEAAYQRTAYAEKINAGEKLDPDSDLESMGWTRWNDFPKGDVKKSVDDVHLRVEVWTNRSKKMVAVTFGGTVARNIKDWKSDLRWFIPHHRDEYTVIVQTFGQNFVDEYRSRANEPDNEFLNGAKLVSTGHSLGGGLAQEFAYSLPRNSLVLPVSKVYAFDPSPVTGYYSVGEQLRNDNTQGLRIDRIYQRGEILAYFRSIINFIYPPSASNPTVRQLRYNLSFHSLNPFADHSMAKFALKLKQLAQPKASS